MTTDIRVEIGGVGKVRYRCIRCHELIEDEPIWNDEKPYHRRCQELDGGA